VTDGSSSDAFTVLLRWMGLERFSGPGAPSVAPESEPSVTRAKSAALSPVSCGRPEVIFRTWK
jgi:hypothetical protein